MTELLQDLLPIIVPQNESKIVPQKTFDGYPCPSPLDEQKNTRQLYMIENGR